MSDDERDSPENTTAQSGASIQEVGSLIIDKISLLVPSFKEISQSVVSAVITVYILIELGLRPAPDESDSTDGTASTETATQTATPTSTPVSEQPTETRSEPPIVDTGTSIDPGTPIDPPINATTTPAELPPPPTFTTTPAEDPGGAPMADSPYIAVIREVLEILDVAVVLFVVFLVVIVVSNRV